MQQPQLHPLVPGAKLSNDWFDGKIPQNISVGENCVVDSSFCFERFFSSQQPGLRIGNHVTLWRTALATESEGVIEIGDYCYLANASLVCAQRITLGSYVFVGGGVTIVDADFHPLDPAPRLADTIALSTLGDRRRRPHLEAAPIIIEDDVWIGFNATILKGIRVGKGAVIEPGTVVTSDVPPEVRLSGNPARTSE